MVKAKTAKTAIKTTAIKTTIGAAMQPDEQYDQFEMMIRSQIAGLKGPLFDTDAAPEELWNAYLSALPADRRQHYTCNACRRFIQKYGSLVTIDDQGMATPALWSFEAPEFFNKAIKTLRKLVMQAKVIGVFLSSDTVWGTPKTGEWTHLSGNSPFVYADKCVNAGQKMAEKLEDYRMLSHGLADYPKPVADQALRILKADALDRSEKTVGVAEWFVALHEKIANNPRKHNLIWAAVATAPVGFCHIRSSMISTLLDDIVVGLEFDVIARRWAEKMHPLRYQRPTAPPSTGTIEQAEKLVEKLGVAKSLDRRFATLDDVLKKLWVPRTPTPPAKTGGVFDHLRQSKTLANSMELPEVRITWEKFARTVLADATDIEILVPGHGSFYGLVTATDPDAPAIIQWDGLEGHPRNPVSWYFYHSGSHASDWGLASGWTKISAIFLSPHAWQEPSKFAHQGMNIYFAIPGCCDTRTSSLCLFPEILKSEFRSIRSVIEAHSKSGCITGAKSANANGLALQKNGGGGVKVRTYSNNGLANYLIDRFD